MRDSFEEKLRQLRDSYTQVAGEPFRHFFCPILLRDEESELCKAHILNQAFPNTSRRYTVQRADVDGFFGSLFESSFTSLQFIGTPMEALCGSESPDKGLRPELYLKGKKVEYYLPRRPVPANHSQLLLQGRSGSVKLAVKMHPEEMEQAEGGGWNIVLQSDCRLAALVSILKAAHLAMFDMLGYSYALSLGGLFLGHTILGTFFKQNWKLSKAEALRNGQGFFPQYANLVRPVLHPENGLEDTLRTRTFYLCEEPSVWAFLILLRTDSLVHSALIPVLESDQAVSRFVGFLEAKESTLRVRKCHFDGDVFQASPAVEHFFWPEAKFDCT